LWPGILHCSQATHIVIYCAFLIVTHDAMKNSIPTSTEVTVSRMVQSGLLVTSGVQMKRSTAKNEKKDKYLLLLCILVPLSDTSSWCKKALKPREYTHDTCAQRHETLVHSCLWFVEKKSSCNEACTKDDTESSFDRLTTSLIHFALLIKMFTLMLP
jgi:hypothetical protein